jgi:hypothetical protein
MLHGDLAQLWHRPATRGHRTICSKLHAKPRSTEHFAQSYPLVLGPVRWFPYSARLDGQRAQHLRHHGWAGASTIRQPPQCWRCRRHLAGGVRPCWADGHQIRASSPVTATFFLRPRNADRVWDMAVPTLPDADVADGNGRIAKRTVIPTADGELRAPWAKREPPRCSAPSRDAR